MQQNNIEQNNTQQRIKANIINPCFALKGGAEKVIIEMAQWMIPTAIMEQGHPEQQSPVFEFLVQISANESMAAPSAVPNVFSV